MYSLTDKSIDKMAIAIEILKFLLKIVGCIFSYLLTRKMRLFNNL